jgi:crotonobetainyl-CoA:carnitine CoA-transferase CaiB-like acyl-CoA transferase
VQARGLVQSVGDIPLIASPVQFSATPSEIRTPPPALGQHTDAVLAERLGMSAADIARLREAGAV